MCRNSVPFGTGGFVGKDGIAMMTLGTGISAELGASVSYVQTSRTLELTKLRDLFT